MVTWADGLAKKVHYIYTYITTDVLYIYRLICKSTQKSIAPPPLLRARGDAVVQQCGLITKVRLVRDLH